MRTFRDKNGTEHNVEFTIGTMRRVKKDLDIDLTSLTEVSVIELLADVISCVDILHIATDTTMDADEFADVLGGDSCEHALDAMFAALADFFPSSRRGTMEAVIKKANELTDEAHATVKEKIEAITFGELLTEQPA